MKAANPGTYAVILTQIIGGQAPGDVRSMAAVILRRNMTPTSDTDVQHVFKLMTPEQHTFMKEALLAAILGTQEKSILHKICNLVVEVQGAMWEYQNEAIWQEMLNMLFGFITTNEAMKVDAALQIMCGLFSNIIDHLVKYKKDLYGIFQTTLAHADLDVQLSALQALSNYLQVAENKDTKDFVQLIEPMAAVVMRAYKEDEETTLEDALMEFNDIAEVEPKFFRKNFKDLFNAFIPIVAKGDFTKPLIRHQPIELIMTIAERMPNLLKKDDETLGRFLDTIFRLMIDIDEDIDDDWLQPKEGFRADEDEEEEDQVHFGKNIIDRLVGAVGEKKMLPLLSALCGNSLADNMDWRTKHAGLMALSQVGEYIEDITHLAQMLPMVLKHLMHENPKVRYAALHCIGQLSDDQTEDFQETYYETVYPALIKQMSDPIPRVQSHTLAALTNFLEGANEEIAM